MPGWCKRVEGGGGQSERHETLGNTDVLAHDPRVLRVDSWVRWMWVSLQEHITGLSDKETDSE